MNFDRIIGEHSSIVKAKQQTEQAKNLRVLFYGETGVGKTPFARYSNWVVSQLEGKNRPFEQINCACLSPEQFQDQLFGHKKGAFTGAIADKMGLVEIAEGGDLFLDEIGDMPLSTQAHFLTFLDTMEYYRLGDDRKRRANVRVLCATNRDLKEMVEEGRFRRDLYSRISQVVVHISPLRERASDIPLLVKHFLKKFAGGERVINPKVIEIFTRYQWLDGNIRELKDAVEYLVMMSQGEKSIEAYHLGDRYFSSPVQLTVNADTAVAQRDPKSDLKAVYEVGLETYLGMVERELLDNLLRSHNGCMDKLARSLKTSRSTLYRRIKKYEGLAVA